MVGPACGVVGYPGREVVAQGRYADCSKVQEVATRADTHVGAQQSTVPKRHQICTSASGQLLKAAQVRGLLFSELRLHTVASHILQVQ